MADITDRAAIASAVDGCAGVFAMTTPFEDGPEAEIAQGAALVGAFSDSGVPHVVFSSAADADKSTDPTFRHEGCSTPRWGGRASPIGPPSWRDVCGKQVVDEFGVEVVDHWVQFGTVPASEPRRRVGRRYWWQSRSLVTFAGRCCSGARRRGSRRERVRLRGRPVLRTVSCRVRCSRRPRAG